MNKIRIGYIESVHSTYGFIIDCETEEKFFVHRNEFTNENGLPNQKLNSEVVGKYVSFSIGMDNVTKKIAANNVKIINPSIESISNFNFPSNINQDSKSKETLNSSKFNTSKKVHRLNKLNEYYIQEVATEDQLLFGDIISYNLQTGFGRLKDAAGTNRTYHIKDVRNKIILKNGDKVTFTPATYKDNKENQYRALNITKLDEKKVDETKIELFKDTKEKWKLEAKSEMKDMPELFYKIEEYGQIISGKKCFVIGRKGSGKSAISKCITSINEYNHFVQELKLNDFIFSEIYDEIQDKRKKTQNKHFYVLV